MMNIEESRNNLVNIAYMNIRGQTGLPLEKQLQIENFLVQNDVDILHCQEIDIAEDTFNECKVISTAYSLISNNSLNKYGTATLVKNELNVENISFDENGRVIVFDVENVTFGNFYLPSGTDAETRLKREKYFCEIIPKLLINSKDSGCLGGDFNCIIALQDATKNPESKISPGLKRLVNTFTWKDSFRSLYPNSLIFSRYYESQRYGEGASRIDRNYHYGDIEIIEAKYISIAFSDHMACSISIKLPEFFTRILSPKSRPLFKTKPEVIHDKIFQNRLRESMAIWEEVKALGVPVMNWWEGLVKPGIRKLAINRSKEIKKERRSELNLLVLRQSYLTRKLQRGRLQLLADLNAVHLLINQWYDRECEKVKHQSRVEDIIQSEKVRIYHHEIHHKHLKKTSILKLEVGNEVLEGHSACAKFLEESVSELLLHPVELDRDAQECLLLEVEPVFSDSDNEQLLSPPTKEDVKEVLDSSNLQAAPGSDGITSLLYKVCWDILGDPLTEIMKAIHSGQQPSVSQRTSLMVFGAKPKKLRSLKPGDKRKISLLNSDFKIATGIEAKKFKQVSTHTLSPNQLVAGDNRRMHHGINLARDAIFAASKSKQGCGILDTDYMAAFDYLVMHWVFKVLLKKGVSRQVINRLHNLYRDNITVVVVNNILGRAFVNNRLSLRQGDLPSMTWFAYGIDPLIQYLEKRLTGILIHSLPLLGPVAAGAPHPLHPLEQRYTVIGFADDLKPAVSSMNEFLLVDRASAMFERSSGCKLHRDPASKKCKFLPLGRWRGVLTQEDVPCPYMLISDHLDMLGVELRATHTQTRKVNGDQIQDRVKNTIGPWQSGRFMSLTQRPWSVNSYAISKVWFKCNCIDIRALDSNSVTSKVKAWIFADLLEKPEEMICYRPSSYGGLGLHHVKYKALAMLIHSFLETAANPKYLHNLYHTSLYRYHILMHRDIPDPGHPPYYSEEFFSIIRSVHQRTPLNITTMSSTQWYTILLEDNITMEVVEETETRQYKPSRAELASPGTDWRKTWYLARLRGLGPELQSFLWKLLHRLLPTQERISRILKNRSSLCQLCDDQILDDLLHTFFHCKFNAGAGTSLLNCLATHSPSITPHQVLTLNFDAEESKELSLTWFTGQFLQNIWSTRTKKKQPQLYTIRADLEAKISLLRETRFQNVCLQIEEMIQNL